MRSEAAMRVTSSQRQLSCLMLYSNMYTWCHPQCLQSSTLYFSCRASSIVHDNNRLRQVRKVNDGEFLNRWRCVGRAGTSDTSAGRGGGCCCNAGAARVSQETPKLAPNWAVCLAMLALNVPGVLGACGTSTAAFVGPLRVAIHGHRRGKVWACVHGASW